MTSCPHCSRELPDSFFTVRERDREAELRSMTKRKGPSLGVSIVPGEDGEPDRVRFYPRPPPADSSLEPE